MATLTGPECGELGTSTRPINGGTRLVPSVYCPEWNADREVVRDNMDHTGTDADGSRFDARPGPIVGIATPQPGALAGTASASQLSGLSLLSHYLRRSRTRKGEKGCQRSAVTNPQTSRTLRPTQTHIPHTPRPLEGSFRHWSDIFT